MKTSGCIHDGWLVIRTPEKLIDKMYMCYLFLSVHAKKSFDSAAAGAVNPGGVVGVDGDYTGTAGDDLPNSILQLTLIGNLVCTADLAAVVQFQTFEMV